jgi:hypothetical protein
MGKAISQQPPAVVLRSRYDELRALLAVALVAMAGLTTAVVVEATDDSSTGTPASQSEDLPVQVPARGVLPHN